VREMAAHPLCAMRPATTTMRLRCSSTWRRWGRARAGPLADGRPVPRPLGGPLVPRGAQGGQRTGSMVAEGLCGSATLNG
jgi:hypothetical protein